MFKEKDFQTSFTKWLKYKYQGSGCFELKLCKEKSLPFSAVEPHQIQALLNAKHQHIEFKIPDVGYQNPFDCFRLEHVPAFVVIMFYRRGQKEFFMIDIDDFVSEIQISERKSLTENRVREIGLSASLV